MTKNSEKTSLKFMVISAIALIMVFGAAAPAIVPANATDDEPDFDISINKMTTCADAFLYQQLDCEIWITNNGDDETIIVETIPASMDVVDETITTFEGAECTIEKASKGGDNKRNASSQAKNNSATKITCVLQGDGDDIHFDIESNTNNGNKQRPTSCGAENDFEVNGGVDAFATDGAGNLLLVQLHDGGGNPIDGDGNAVAEGEFLVPILVDSTDPVFVPVSCPV